MASLLFEDIEFPAELYNKKSPGEFTTPVKTLLEFAPQILTELAKPAAEQKPVGDTKPTPKDSARDRSESSSNYSGLASVALKEGIRAGVRYFESKAEDKRQDRRNAAEPDRGSWWFGSRNDERTQREDRERQEREDARSERERKETERRRKEEEKNKRKSTTDAGEVVGNDPNYGVVAAQAAGIVTAVSMSLYGTYKASATYGEVTFRQQLNLLIENVEEILQSTKAWIQEQELLGRKVPPIVLSDVARIEKLISALNRLDDSDERKKATFAWGLGSAGAIGTAVGIGFGSVAAATGGLAVVGAGVAYGVIAVARHSTKQWKASRALVESEARTVLEVIERRDSSLVARSFGLDSHGDPIGPSRTRTSDASTDSTFVEPEYPAVPTGTPFSRTTKEEPRNSRVKYEYSH